MERNRAYRRWKTLNKLISRIKERFYYWHIKDPNAPNKVRKAKNWKEIESFREAKMYKKTTVRYADGWKKVENRKRIKSYREEGKKIINDDLKKTII